MAWYNPFSWGKKKPDIVDEPTEEESGGVAGDQSGDDFSTNLRPFRAMKQKALNQWIHDNAFQVKGSDVLPVDDNGDPVGDSYAMDSQTVKGAYTLAAGNLPQVLFSWYVRQGFIGYQACAIIAQNGLVDRACSLPGKDALKKGYDLTVCDGSDVDVSVIAKLRACDKQFNLRKQLKEFDKKHRVFGIRIALFVVDSDDEDYYFKPFNIDGIKPGSYKGIVQVDPYWITPELDSEASSNPASMEFYEPTWWRINGKRYHRSHLIVIRYTEVADVLKPSYIYGGIPLPQLIYERCYSAERTANEGPQLAMTKRRNVLKTNIEKALANQEALEERLQYGNDLQDNYQVTVLDKNEDFQQTDTALGDLDAVIMTQYQLVASLSGLPATKLLGTSPKGFAATGVYEQENYYDLLEGVQDNYSMLLERHYQILIRSKIAPEEKVEPFEVEIKWKPLKSMTPKEEAEVGEIKMRTDQGHIAMGSVDAYEVRDRLIADPISGYNGLQSFEAMEMTDTESNQNDLLGANYQFN